MGSLSNDFALEATRIARIEGWLTDGSLKGVFLTRANLQAPNLASGNLQGADPQEVLYISKPIWPIGFEPIAVGAIFVDEQEQSGA
jgi:hypothetical protein